MAEIVRRRSFGAVLPLGRHISISGSRPIQCASDSIALSSFQEEQNARHYKQFKFEQALAGVGAREREALAQAVLKDVGTRPGDLALVQFALTETWQLRGQYQ